MHRPLIQLAATFALCTSTLAQERIVEQMVEDVDPLATSLRHMQQDLRTDTDFSTLYADPRYPGWFYRRHLGITAFVPQGDYVATRAGIVPLVPPGTIYFIGEPSPEDLPALPASSAPQFFTVTKAPQTRQPVQFATSVVGATSATQESARRIANPRIVPLHADEILPMSTVQQERVNRRPTPSIMREDEPYRAMRLRDIAAEAFANG